MSKETETKPELYTLLCGVLVTNISDGKLYRIEYEITKHGKIGIRRCFKNGKSKRPSVLCETTPNMLEVYST